MQELTKMRWFTHDGQQTVKTWTASAKLGVVAKMSSWTKMKELYGNKVS